MKSVNIHIEYDPEADDVQMHEMSCYEALNGSYFHDSLKGIHKVLYTYDNKRKRKLSPQAQKVLDDIRGECAAHLAGIRHDKKK